MFEMPLTDDRRLHTRALQAAAVLTAVLAGAAMFGVPSPTGATPLLASALGVLVLAAAMPLVVRAGEVRTTALVLAVLGVAPPIVAGLAPQPSVLLAAACLLVGIVALAAVVLPPLPATAPAVSGAAGFGVALAVAGVVAFPVAWVALVLVLATVSGVVGILAQHVRGLGRTDPVTLVANRRFWEHTVEHECARAGRTTHPLCVAVVVLDDFRQYAFERGPAAAEQLLREAATSWQDQVRAGDLVGRLGPDQLAVLLPECGSAAAKLVLRRLQAATPPGRTCSAGLAMWNGAESPASLVERAAGALRLAQRTGRASATISSAA